MLTQGDQYSIYDKITENGIPIDIAKIKKIEFALGKNIKKYYPQEVQYESQSGIFSIPLTQEETYSLEDRFEYQVAIQLKDGDIYHTIKQNYPVSSSVTRTVFSNE